MSLPNHVILETSRKSSKFTESPIDFTKASVSGNNEIHMNVKNKDSLKKTLFNFKFLMANNYTITERIDGVYYEIKIEKTAEEIKFEEIKLRIKFNRSPAQLTICKNIKHQFQELITNVKNNTILDQSQLDELSSKLRTLKSHQEETEKEESLIPDITSGSLHKLPTSGEGSWKSSGEGSWKSRMIRLYFNRITWTDSEKQAMRGILYFDEVNIVNTEKDTILEVKGRRDDNSDVTLRLKSIVGAQRLIYWKTRINAAIKAIDLANDIVMAAPALHSGVLTDHKKNTLANLAIKATRAIVASATATTAADAAAIEAAAIEAPAIEAAAELATVLTATLVADEESAPTNPNLANPNLTSVFTAARVADEHTPPADVGLTHDESSKDEQTYATVQAFAPPTLLKAPPSVNGHFTAHVITRLASNEPPAVGQIKAMRKDAIRDRDDHTFNYYTMIIANAVAPAPADPAPVSADAAADAAADLAPADAAGAAADPASVAQPSAQPSAQPPAPVAPKRSGAATTKAETPMLSTSVGGGKSRKKIHKYKKYKKSRKSKKHKKLRKSKKHKKSKKYKKSKKSKKSKKHKKSRKFRKSRKSRKIFLLL